MKLIRSQGTFFISNKLFEDYQKGIFWRPLVNKFKINWQGMAAAAAAAAVEICCFDEST